MSNLVTVKLSDQGEAVRVSKNPEFGYVVLEQKAIEIKNGWMTEKVLTSIIQGKTEQLLAYDFSKPLVGKIVVQESIIPFNTKLPDRDLKFAGDTGVVCMVNDDPIYRITKFDFNPNAVSVYVKHTNSEEIREANSENSTSINNVGSLHEFAGDSKSIVEEEEEVSSNVPF